MPLRQASYVQYKCIIQIKLPRKIASHRRNASTSSQMIMIPHEIYFLPRARDVPVVGSSAIFINEMDRATL